MHTRALRFAAIALTAILAVAACGGPDAAEVAVDEFCDELKYLIREQRLARVADQQFVEAYRDLLESLVDSNERVGRPLGPIVATKCPAASNDAERTKARLALPVEAQLAESRQEGTNLEPLRQTDSASDVPKEVPSSPSPANSVTPNIPIHTPTDTPTSIPLAVEATNTPYPTRRTHTPIIPLFGTERQERFLFYARNIVEEEWGLYVLSANSGELIRLDLNVTKDNTDIVEEIGFLGTDWDLSSDNRYLAVSHFSFMYDENDRNVGRLFSIDLSNLTMERLIEPPTNCHDNYPLWSPMGDKVMFEEICAGGYGGIRKLGVIDVNSKTRIYVKDTESSLDKYTSRSDFEFSPDGNSIIGFTEDPGDNSSDATIVRSVVIYNFPQSTWRDIPVTDPKQMINTELSQLKLKSKISSAIFSNSHNIRGDRSLGGVFFSDHSLSPDGHTLAVRGAIIDYDHNFRKEFVSLIAVRAGTVVKMIYLDGDESGTSFRRLDGKPSWSPDGRLLALGVGGKEANENHAFVVDIENESIWPLTGSDGFLSGTSWSTANHLGVSWSKDSTHLLIGGCISDCGEGDSKNAIRKVNAISGEYRTFASGTAGQIWGLQWLSEADQEPPTTTHIPIAKPPPPETATRTATSTRLPSTMDGKSVDELRLIVHDEFGNITLSLAEVFVHYDSEQQRPLAIESMQDAIDSCLLSKQAIDQLGIIDSSHELWPRVAENVGRYCDHLSSASKSLIDWNLIKFTQSISNAMSALDDAAADVPRL